MTVVDDADSGRGAQLERTVLAWNRVAIALGGNGALLVRTGFIRHLGVIEGIGLAIVAVSVGLWMLSFARYAAMAGHRAGHLIVGHPRVVLGASATVAALSLLDLSVVIAAR